MKVAFKRLFARDFYPQFGRQLFIVVIGSDLLRGRDRNWCFLSNATPPSSRLLHELPIINFTMATEIIPIVFAFSVVAFVVSVAIFSPKEFAHIRHLWNGSAENRPRTSDSKQEGPN